jgi:hypothetical protein
VSVMTLDSRVKVNDDVLFQELQGEAVLLNLKSGVYFGLDPVGTRIWQLFAEHELLAEIRRRRGPLRHRPADAGGGFGEAGTGHAELGARG